MDVDIGCSGLPCHQCYLWYGAKYDLVDHWSWFARSRWWYDLRNHLCLDGRYLPRSQRACSLPRLAVLGICPFECAWPSNRWHDHRYHRLALAVLHQYSIGRGNLVLVAKG